MFKPEKRKRDQISSSDRAVRAWMGNNAIYFFILYAPFFKALISNKYWIQAFQNSAQNISESDVCIFVDNFIRE